MRKRVFTRKLDTDITVEQMSRAISITLSHSCLSSKLHTIRCRCHAPHIPLLQYISLVSCVSYYYYRMWISCTPNSLVSKLFIIILYYIIMCVRPPRTPRLSLGRSWDSARLATHILTSPQTSNWLNRPKVLATQTPSQCKFIPTLIYFSTLEIALCRLVYPGNPDARLRNMYEITHNLP